MADAKVQIGLSTDFLEGTSVNTPAGDNLFREGVVISDPDVAAARARITNTAPAADAYGLAVRVIGNLTLGSEVEVKNDAGNPIPVSGSVSVANFPATQAVSGSVTVSQATAANLNATVTGTVAATQSGTWNINNITGTVSLPTGAATAAKQLPDNHQVSVSNFPATQAVSATDLDIRNLSSAQDSVAVSGTVAVSNFPATQSVSGTVTANLGTLNGAALDASVQAINGKLPDESGAWGYNAGTAGTLTVAANKRILSITATAAALAAASMTINGGQTITIPAGTSITISPKANLTAPTLVFTSTASYFVEFIE